AFRTFSSVARLSALSLARYAFTSLRGCGIDPLLSGCLGLAQVPFAMALDQQDSGREHSNSLDAVRRFYLRAGAGASAWAGLWTWSQKRSSIAALSAKSARLGAGTKVDPFLRV